MYAQAFGLVVTPMENELGFPCEYSGERSFSAKAHSNAADQYGNLSSSFSAGLTAGVKHHFTI